MKTYIQETSYVKCQECGKTWVAIRPEGIKNLKCPACKQDTIIVNIGEVFTNEIPD